jgi:nucleoside-diphosphate-sugar epimerase
MKIFLAGGSGAIGRLLVPMLVEAGHEVVAMTRSTDRATSLEAMGASAVIGDVFDAAQLTELVTRAEPDTIIHQLTAFGATDADPLAETIRIQIDGTRNLVQAARAAGAKRSLAQSGTNYDPDASIPRSVRKGRAPIVGDGAGTYSFIHVEDAARATLKALVRAKPGIYDIVDDDPARLSEWLPVVAKLLNAPAPSRVAESAARNSFGDMLVYIMNEQRGASNAKAKRELEWEPRIRSWREGFEAIYR